jgi:hypothetical protein
MAGSHFSVPTSAILSGIMSAMPLVAPRRFSMSWALLVFAASLCACARAAHCMAENGIMVDWWFIYKASCHHH